MYRKYTSSIKDKTHSTVTFSMPQIKAFEIASGRYILAIYVYLWVKIRAYAAALIGDVGCAAAPGGSMLLQNK